ncbi:hypothetical protein D3C85_861950 [compost metagenome]
MNASASSDSVARPATPLFDASSFSFRARQNSARTLAREQCRNSESALNSSSIAPSSCTTAQRPLARKAKPMPGMMKYRLQRGLAPCASTGGSAFPAGQLKAMRSASARTTGASRRLRNSMSAAGSANPTAHTDAFWMMVWQ